MNNLTVFENPEFGSIRTVDLNGAPWLVGKDVAQALGYSDTAKAVRVHVDDEDKGVADLSTPGGIQSFTIINESGLYSLVLSSKLPTAKKFRRWVTCEVLPSIRRTGGYTIPALSRKLERARRLRAEQAEWLHLAQQFDVIAQDARKRYDKARTSRDECRAKADECGAMLDGALAREIGGLS